MTDTYIDGTPCIIACLTPTGEGWREVPIDKRYRTVLAGLYVVAQKGEAA